jgi:hypothetical protein
MQRDHGILNVDAGSVAARDRSCCEVDGLDREVHAL